MELTGIVSSGLGRAHVFIAQDHYQDQFREVLGGKAWPGTLNVQVDETLLSHYIALRQKAGIDTLDAKDSARSDAKNHDVSSYDRIRIRGFLRDGVSFGGASAFIGHIQVDGQRVECALLIPDLTRHVDVIEIISTVFLREEFNLTDGDRVLISL